ncbi:unnamed protein product [Larinioides sclopetarius]|uniref:Uncharacterized protein n=1 Tax=Larinioides sclopetarius TaxID=280406 RepID=A0AAV1YQC8_9ARAC
MLATHHHAIAADIRVAARDHAMWLYDNRYSQLGEALRVTSQTTRYSSLLERRFRILILEMPVFRLT